MLESLIQKLIEELAKADGFTLKSSEDISTKKRQEKDKNDDNTIIVGNNYSQTLRYNKYEKTANKVLSAINEFLIEEGIEFDDLDLCERYDFEAKKND